MTSHPDHLPHCGIVAVIGAPNAGKSTLINALTGCKVSIVSKKVQTTRMNVRGIVMRGNSQIVLTDTPGIFAAEKKIEKAMVAAAWSGRDDADIVLLLHDASRPRERNALNLVGHLKKREKAETILVLNKTDKVKPHTLLELTRQLNDQFPFSATFMISALQSDGTEDLLDHLAARMPEGPYLYPEDQVSDLPARMLAAEITREKLFERLHEELPHALSVETEKWDEDEKFIRIAQVIHVQRDSHKGIVLGKGGAMIKEVGTAARIELETVLEKKIHLDLFVRVSETWADDPDFYRSRGLDERA